MPKLKDVKVGQATIWGIADHVEKVKENVYWVTTPSHGGYCLLEPLAKQLWNKIKNFVEDAYGMSDGWYEEDCNWCIPVLYLHLYAGREDGAKMAFEAEKAMERWHPKLYAHFKK